MELQLFRDVIPEIWNLYETSFPDAERRTLDRHREVITDLRFMPYVIRDNNEFVGILFAWVWGVYCFVEHFAISKKFRCHGYGTKAMRDFHRLMVGRIIILEIDPPNNDIAQRRKTFYERLGYVANNYHHVHPSYGKPQEPQKLIIMSFPERITVDDFIEFQRFTFSVL